MAQKALFALNLTKLLMEAQHSQSKITLEDLHELLQTSEIVENITYDGNVPINLSSSLFFPQITFRNVFINSLVIKEIKSLSVIITESKISKITIELDEAHKELNFELTQSSIENITINKGSFNKLLINCCNINTIYINSGNFKHLEISAENDYNNESKFVIYQFNIIDGKFKTVIFKQIKIIDLVISGGDFINLMFTQKISIGNEPSKYYSQNPQIQGGKFNGVTFSDCFSLHDFGISGGIFTTGITFSGFIQFARSFYISGGVFEKPILMNENLTRALRIRPRGKYFNSIIISSDCKGLILNGSETNIIFIKNLTFIALPTYNTSIKNVRIIYLSFTSHDSILTSTFSISDSKIDSIDFSYFNNHGRMTFNGIQPLQRNGNYEGDYYLGEHSFPSISGISKYEYLEVDKAITIKRANIGILDFISCNLSFYSLYIDSSKLINIFYTNTTFPPTDKILPEKEFIFRGSQKEIKNIKNSYDNFHKNDTKQELYRYGFLIHIYYYTNAFVSIFNPYSKFPDPSNHKILKKYLTNAPYQPEKYLIQLKELFEQLQTVATKQGDIGLANIWQSEVQKYYMKILKFRIDKKSPWLHQDWWLFVFNKISNNFKISYLRGIIFTFGFGILFYILYIIAMDGNLELCIRDCNIIDTIYYICSKYSYQFGEFLNPVHKVDFLKVATNIEATPFQKLLGSIWDFGGRIFVGFGIYQTIQAFRKYGKSSDK